MTGARTVLVCTNVDCAERGSEEVLARFQALAAAQTHDIEARSYLCFSACTKGPNVVIVEDESWYCGVEPSDVDEIRTTHLENGGDVERLTRDADEVTKDLIFSFLDAGVLPDSV